MPSEAIPSIPPVGTGRLAGWRAGAGAVRALRPGAGPRGRQTARGWWMEPLAPFAPRPWARRVRS